jgi:hypothetical protein
MVKTGANVPFAMAGAQVGKYYDEEIATGADEENGAWMAVYEYDCFDDPETTMK